MAIKYINIFQSKALQNLPKLGFLIRKVPIWQPWPKTFKEMIHLEYFCLLLGLLIFNTFLLLNMIVCEYTR
jgi:hypothetical protein